MKNTLFIHLTALYSLLAPIFLSISCDMKSDLYYGGEIVSPNEPEIEEYASFTVNVSTPSTKSIAGTNDENRIGDIQVIVYRSNPGYPDDGVLETQVKASGNSVSLKCTVGKKKIYVLANVPELESVGTENLIKDKHVSLMDDDRDKFQMCGMKTVSIEKNTTSLEVDVTRYVARVHIKNIVCKMEDGYKESEFVPNSLTLINVMSEASVPDYSLSPEQSLFINKGKYVSSDADDMVRRTISGVKLSANGQNTCNTSTSLYAYANSSTNTAHTAVWAPVCTRLVLEAQVDGVTYYYPVNIPGILANHTYEIENLTISKIGSKNPDIPLEPTTCSFNVKVKDWDDIDITSGINL